mmetsp:Transcript_37345/g.89822  ORF Transcript_37345/g.89822 Transcript_37345/m.89822 type:complete len:602 (-) Transcript_37345:268-2073(-)
MSWPPTLEANRPVIPDDAIKLVSDLVSAKQSHLFQSWPAPGTDDDKKRHFLLQLQALDTSYPTGLVGYISNARKLLQENKSGVNPLADFAPSVPVGTKIGDYGCPAFVEMEERGLQEVGKAVVVLVAGGLGERLGYSGIKLELPLTLVDNKCFLQIFSESVAALQAKAGHDARIPFVIMTSDDTDSRTRALLAENRFFGLDETQVHVLKQEKVPTIADSEGSLVLDASGYQLQTKPHGHGDVHALLHQSGLVPRWLDAGKNWVVFIQDTNGLVFRAVPAALGSSASQDFDVNSMSVPRAAKDAVGAICQLTHKEGGSITCNVEYNQLDPLLRASGFPDGDVSDPATGKSIFPGNINQLVFKLKPYHATLQRTGGVIAEFCNPKYTDATKTKFKTPTRLECMMQDYPKALLGTSSKVGFTQMNAGCYCPVKNDPVSAAAQVAKGCLPNSALGAEAVLFQSNCNLFRAMGADIEPGVDREWLGLVRTWEARVLWSPSWACCNADVAAKLSRKAGAVKISQRSTLVLDGADIVVESLTLDGALIIKAVPGAKVVVRASISNDGGKFVALPPDHPNEIERMRGFRIDLTGAQQHNFAQPGEFVVG